MLNERKLIYENYFKENSSLSNLYSWLIEPDDTNKLFIDNNEYLSNINKTTDLHINDDNTSEIKSNFFTLNVLVKNNTNGYNIELYDNHNSLHFLPALNNIKDYITQNLQKEIQKTFIIYQYYDYLFDNPHMIYSFNIDNQPTNYYDIFSNNTINPNNTDFQFPNETLSHIQCLNNSKDKLSLELIFVCRNLMLTLLYKYIYSIYLDFFRICDNLNLGPSTCNSIPTENINSVIVKINETYTKWIELLNDIAANIFNVDFTFNSKQNSLDIEKSLSTPSIDIFDTLIPDKHIIFNNTKGEFVNIKHEINKDANGNYILKANSIYPIPNNGDKCKILTKNSTASLVQYNNKLNKLTNSTQQLQQNKSQYEKSIIDYKNIKNNYTNVDIIYYITIVIVIIVLIAIFAANSNDAFTTRVFILLILVVLTYIIMFSYLEIFKEFTEKFQDVSKSISERTSANSKLLDVVSVIYKLAPEYGKIELYNILNENISQDMKKISFNNRNIILATDTNNSTSNSKWHRLFQRTLFIHTTFLVLIVILTYLWLSTSIPDISMYLFVITILVCMILLFNYFKNLHRVVRTNYRYKYWNKI